MVHLEISEYLASGSLLVAIIALIKSFLSGRKVKKLDLQLKEKDLQARKSSEDDAKKADVEVEVYETAPKKLNKLRFYNKGKTSAFNVSFSIPSDDQENDITLIMAPDYLPYPKLESYQKFEVPFNNNSGKPHQTVRIIWDDDFGKGRTKEMVIDM